MRLPQLVPSMLLALILDVAFAAGPARAEAQPASGAGHSDVGIGLRVGTLGVGLEVSKLLTPHLGARVGANYFKFDKTRTQSNITYDATLKLHAVSALIDFFPGKRGSFHLTGGLMTSPLKVTGTGQPDAGGTFKINGDVYTAAQVGTLSGLVKFPGASPYVGLGFGTPARNGGAIGFAFDLGAAIGKAKVALDATGAANDPQLASDLQAQQAKSQKDLDKLKVYPVLQFGLAYRF